MTTLYTVNTDTETTVLTVTPMLVLVVTHTVNTITELILMKMIMLQSNNNLRWTNGTEVIPQMRSLLVLMPLAFPTTPTPQLRLSTVAMVTLNISANMSLIMATSTKTHMVELALSVPSTATMVVTVPMEVTVVMAVTKTTVTQEAMAALMATMVMPTDQVVTQDTAPPKFQDLVTPSTLRLVVTADQLESSTVRSMDSALTLTSDSTLVGGFQPTRYVIYKW